MTLIDKDALVKQFDGNIEYFTADETIEMIDNAPTIDAVEVVRCKNCEYHATAKVNCKGYLICPASNMEITDNDFCSYGHKKEAT